MPLTAQRFFVDEDLRRSIEVEARRERARYIGCLLEQVAALFSGGNRALTPFRIGECSKPVS